MNISKINIENIDNRFVINADKSSFVALINFINLNYDLDINENIFKKTLPRYNVEQTYILKEDISEYIKNNFEDMIKLYNKIIDDLIYHESEIDLLMRYFRNKSEKKDMFQLESPTCYCED